MKMVEQNEPVVAAQNVRSSVRLPLGLLGFESVKEYSVIGCEEEAPFRWLEAANDPALTFLIVPAFDVLPEYAPQLSDEDAKFLSLESPAQALIYAVVTLRGPGRATANLKGPIVVNRSTGVGKQVVLLNAAQYPLQYVLPSAE